MTVLRRIARPLLASVFISGGVDALRETGPRLPGAEGVPLQVLNRISALNDYDEPTLTRLAGGIQVAAGSLLALGKFRRLSALALAVSIVPTTAAGHRFWEADDAEQRSRQQMHFLKNASILGGLLLAAADTDGKPGLGWRAHHTAEHAEAAIERSRRATRRAARTARREAEHAAKTGRRGAEHLVKSGRREAKLAAKTARNALPV